MKLSIIVPVYNMEKEGRLEYCLNSLLRQTLDDYEIIAVDDASADGSAAILRRYEAENPGKLRALYLSENHRQGGAKNAGLEMARGEYIGFMDSDDWAAPDMYEKLWKKADETGADLVGCDYCFTWEHSMERTQRIAGNKPQQAGVLDDEKYRSLILDSGSLVVKIYARRLFEEPKLRFPEHMFYEDNAVATALVTRAQHFEYLEEALYYYYQHDTSTVHTISEERCRDRLEAMRIMVRTAKEDGSFERFLPEIEFRFINLFYQNTLFSYMQAPQKKSFAFIRMLGKGIREAFPEFQKNSYYLGRVNAQERKLMALQQKSTILFFLYYEMIQMVRKLRSRK